MISRKVLGIELPKPPERDQTAPDSYEDDAEVYTCVKMDEGSGTLDLASGSRRYDTCLVVVVQLPKRFTMVSSSIQYSRWRRLWKR